MTLTPREFKIPRFCLPVVRRLPFARLAGILSAGKPAEEGWLISGRRSIGLVQERMRILEFQK
jgi:hypothetical protein